MKGRKGKERERERENSERKRRSRSCAKKTGNEKGMSAIEGG